MPTLQEYRQKALQAGYTPEEIRAFEEKNAEKLQALPDYAPVATGSSQPNPQPQKSDGGFMDSLLYGNALPFAGSVIGGIPAGLVGTAMTGPGGAAFGAAGAGLGYGGGRILQEALQDILGKQDQTPLEKTGDVARGSAVTGASDYVGGKLFGLLGKALKPVGRTIVKTGQRLPTVLTGKASQERLKKELGEEVVGNASTVIDDILNRKTGIRPVKYGAAAIKESEDVYKQMLNNIDELGLSDDVAVKTDDLVGSLLEGLDPEGISSGQLTKTDKAFTRVADDLYSKWGDNLSPEDLLKELKTTYSKLYTDSGKLTTSQAAEQEARKIVNRQIRQILADQYPQISDDLTKYSNLKNIQTLAEYNLQRNENTGLSLFITEFLNQLVGNPSFGGQLGKGFYYASDALPPVGRATGNVLGQYGYDLSTQEPGSAQLQN